LTQQKKLAKVFVWLAWIIALALLMFLFQDVLDEQYNPNSRPEMRLSESGQAEVILAQNRQGHYVARGTINETPVTFYSTLAQRKYRYPRILQSN